MAIPTEVTATVHRYSWQPMQSMTATTEELVVDTTAPTIAAVSSSTADGSYGAGVRLLKSAFR